MYIRNNGNRVNLVGYRGRIFAASKSFKPARLNIL